MQRFILLAVFIVFTIKFSFAQIRATTEGGNKVLLYENGTWKYDEKSELPTEVATVAAISIDSTKEITIKPENLFYLPSPRLVRYFGDSGGNIRCKLGCSNNLGVVKLHFIWEFPVSDGNRYFGWFKKDSKVVLTMANDQKIELLMGDENNFKPFEKNNYSVISNVTQPLTKAQIAALSKTPFDKMEVAWKKKTEEYDIEQSRFLVDMLPTVF